MFANPLKSPEGKKNIAELGKNIREQKLSSKNKQRKADLAKRIIVKKPEHGHEERLHKRMSEEGDRTANDYR